MLIGKEFGMKMKIKVFKLIRPGEGNRPGLNISPTYEGGDKLTFN